MRHIYPLIDEFFAPNRVCIILKSGFKIINDDNDNNNNNKNKL